MIATAQRSTRSMRIPVSGLFPMLVTCLVLCFPAYSQQPSSLGVTKVERPPAFVPNEGQWKTEARFMSRHASAGVLVYDDGVGLSLLDRGHPGGHAVLLRQRVEGMAAGAAVHGVEPLPGVENFLIGNDPAKWRTRLPRFSSVRVGTGDTGPSLLVKVSDHALRQELSARSADELAGLSIRWEGATGLSLDGDGTLRIATVLGELRATPPVGRELRPDGSQAAVPVHFRLRSDGSLGLQASAATPGSGVIASTTLIWSSFLGGSDFDSFRNLLLPPGGDVILAGPTSSTDFPVTPGAYSVRNNGMNDILIVRMTPELDQIVSATYLGGTDSDFFDQAHLAAPGDVVIVGETKSADYPTTPGVVGPTFHGGVSDGYISRLSVDGTTLLASTYIGAPSGSVSAVRVFDFASDSSLICAARTCALDFPTTPGAVAEAAFGNCDVVVFKIDAALTSFEFSTYLGGVSMEDALSVVVDTDDTILVSGSGSGTDYPVTPGAYMEQAHVGCVSESWITRLDPTGSSIIWWTLFDGAAWIHHVYPNGDLLLVGSSFCWLGFETTPGALPLPNNPFACRFDKNGQFKVWSTLTSAGVGPGAGGVSFVAVDDQERITIVGSTNSLTGGLAVTPDAFQPAPTPGALTDAFVMQLDAGATQILYNTYLGGFANGNTVARAVKRMSCGEALVVGDTFSPFFPIVGDNPFDPTFNGGRDGFIARVQVISPWTNLGGSLQGSTGRPKLKGGGGLCEHSTAQLQLTTALPGALAALVMGFTNVSLPFKGGTLVPSPDLIFFGLPVDANGQLLLVADWPPGIPPGVQLAMQYWIADPGTPAGYSASNGLLAVTP